ncbi:cyclin-D1-binding protein 1 homolog isoform X2 [Zootermopsis nevadensis]|uniref:Cyclin-D1-binding protein 1-like protein n=1 Tax=Zootermopsis nevadensis TaxID=136037 RepID=A0A067R0J6_ZOONE|nr:cyclin-D1-binding protein 1 homolog isoform X2 [Zootermopsis nevadensis]KDR10977.1 Cyclin-D1-binding protein 1-like protein [Zootermopsis nevadensis]
MAESLGNVFDTVVDHMQFALQQLEGGEGVDKSNCEFSLDDFWLKLRVSSKYISNEVTKLCLAFSKSPLPGVTQTHEMLRTLETAYLEVLSTFYTLPKSCGLVLRKEVNMAVLQIVESLITVVMSLQEEGDKAQKDRLMLTGRVWDACEAIEGLPQNNLQVTCKIIQREDGLVLDALQEIEEEVAAEQSGNGLRTEEEEEEDNSMTWSNQDRELLFPCMGLVKTARSSFKRIGAVLQIKGKFETEEQISQLDDLVSKSVEISPAVDDMVSCMYPPMNKDAVRSAAAVLKTRVEALLHMVKQSHYATEEDIGWIEFLLKAVAHNNNKLLPLLNS